MSQLDDVVVELKELFNRGAKLAAAPKRRKRPIDLRISYESWYTKALSAVRHIIPEREEEFRLAYRRSQREQLDRETYTIDNYLLGVEAPAARMAFQPDFDVDDVFNRKFLVQVGILGAALDLAPSKLRDIRSALQSEILDADMVAAGELLKTGHLRSAGVVCGVALEAHLKAVAARRQIVIPKKKATLGDLNDLMKASNVYDEAMRCLVQRLAAIRNLCAHQGAREPTRDDLDDLIRGTDKVLKEIA